MSYPLRKKLYVGVGTLVIAVAGLTGCDDDSLREFTDAMHSLNNSEKSDSSNMAQLSWLAPTEKVNGDPLMIHRIKEYVIYYGQDPISLDKTITLNDDNSGRMEYVVGELDAGEWYFTVRAVDVDGQESTLSQMVTKEI
ncbi:MAG: hypothetical protein EA349_12845 [Halomonadaceae bacterium]|nr:MAG: hypothetical protein EA349_12845 [Halomonadaceae bacterium]